MPKRNLSAGRGAAPAQRSARPQPFHRGRPGSASSNTLCFGCSPVLALFSVIGAMQVVVLLYFVMGYVTGPAAPPPEASRKFLDEIDADAPEGVQRNLVHHSESSASGGSGGGAAGSFRGGSNGGGGSSFAADNFVDDGSWSSYNIRNRNAPRSVFEQQSAARYTPNDAWLKARPAWVDNPLRERARPSAKQWDAAAKGAPKFPARAALDKIYADVERLYIAEADANMQGAAARGQFVLKPAEEVPGTHGEQCLDNLGHGVGEAVGIFACHGGGGSQAWSLTGGRVCQTSVKREVCLTVVDRNRGKPSGGGGTGGPAYAVEFQPAADLAHPTALLDAQLWDMKMKTVHGDVSIKSRVVPASSASGGGDDGLCLVVQDDAEPGSIPEVRVGPCSAPTAAWSKQLYKPPQANNKAATVDPDYEEYAFNKPLSMKIGTHREEPERRPAQCRTGFAANDEVGKYDPSSESLPTASVVIAFVNEEFYTLMRTVWAVLQESPPHLLHEVFIVDDGSDVEWLHAPLEEYMRIALPDKVKVLRLSHRQGLVQARLKGARAATGDVLVFLDSHVEATKGWLQPLLRRIKADRTLAVCPEIPAISTTTLALGRGAAQSKGVFDWTMTFTWAGAAHPDPSVPIISPTMAGGLFAIERNFFFEVGTYDEGMMVWGAENLEMSFRLWTCGGGIEIVPCSVVGHIYRSVTGTLAKRSGDYISLNTRRLVDVWLDDYKDVYYSGNPGALTKPVGEHLEDRVTVRKAMQCEPFSNYLDKHFPDMIRPNKEHTQARGYIRNPNANQCWDTGGGKSHGSPVGLYMCHHMGGNQAMAFTNKQSGGQVFAFSSNNCLAYNAGKKAVQINQCKGGGTHWDFDKAAGTMRPQQDSTQCATARSAKLVMEPCSGIPEQRWEWSEYVQ